MAAPDLSDLSDSAFRARYRAWLEEAYPPEWRDPLLRLRGAEARRWIRLQHDAGWRAPAWPREHGGLGLPVGRQIILHEESERHGIARILDHGARMVGPVLMRYGTAAQRARYLPPILRGEEIWAQGYSEPNAGSDLAGLRTAAVRDGDAFVVNGQKTWTTQAADATHIYLLARTSRGEKRQQGITFLLVEADLPGITMRPIRNLAGEGEFYEVFLDDVRVPAENVVGEVDGGWTVAKALLGFERFSHGSPALARLAFGALDSLARALGLMDDPRYADRVARLACDLHDTAALYGDLLAAVEAALPLDGEYSISKLLSAELFQRVTDLLVEMAGELPGPLDPDAAEGHRRRAHRLFIAARPVTIFGGTSEVQRNILAKGTLRLP